ncbi:uncharacterized protein LOC142788236 [Rhipicephalus microplus]|uniref:uncharacterized protein LOC142788236 n=1 Tax=Rhipicephalus microplus TaxID=6941 RepID=UPI003F6C400B
MSFLKVLLQVVTVSSFADKVGDAGSSPVLARDPGSRHADVDPRGSSQQKKSTRHRRLVRATAAPGSRALLPGARLPHARRRCKVPGSRPPSRSPPGTTKTCAAPASAEPLPTRVQLDCTLQVTHEPRPTGGLRGPPTRMATPFELPRSHEREAHISRVQLGARAIIVVSSQH